MVVFEENSIKEADSMVISTATGSGVFFQDTVSWGCFSSIEESSVGVFEDRGEFAGIGSDAAKTLNEVK